MFTALPTASPTGVRARPLAAAAVGWVGLVLAVTILALPDLQRAVRGNPDLAVPLALARVDLAGDQGTALTGQHSWYIGYWATDLLDWIGLGTRPILVIPGILWIVTSLYLGAFWWRRGDRLGAALSTGLVLVLGRAMYPVVAAWDGRGGTAQLTGGAATLLVATQGRSAGRPRLVALLVFIAGLFASLSAASDPFGLFSAVVPLLAGVGVLYRAEARAAWGRLVAFVLGGLAAGAVGTVVLASLTHVQGAGNPVRLRADIFTAFATLYQDGSVLWSDQSVLTGEVTSHSALLTLAFAAGWLLVALVAAAAFAGVRGVLRGVKRAGPPEELQWGLAPWVVFWASSLVLQAAVYLFTSVSATEGFAGARYLVVWWVAIAALAPLALRLPSRTWSWLAIASALVVVVVGGGRNAIDLVDQGGRPAGYYGEGVPLAAADVVQKTARRFGATHGYSGYFTSFSLGMGGSEVPVYPTTSCGKGRLPNLCASGIGSRPSMYRDRPGRSFVVLDTRQPPATHAIQAPPDVALKRVAVQYVAPGLAMIVYDGDLGAYVQSAYDQTVQHGPVPAR